MVTTEIAAVTAEIARFCFPGRHDDGSTDPAERENRLRRVQIEREIIKKNSVINERFEENAKGQSAPFRSRLIAANRPGLEWRTGFKIDDKPRRRKRVWFSEKIPNIYKHRQFVYWVRL